MEGKAIALRLPRPCERILTRFDDWQWMHFFRGKKGQNEKGVYLKLSFSSNFWLVVPGVLHKVVCVNKKESAVRLLVCSSTQLPPACEFQRYKDFAEMTRGHALL